MTPREAVILDYRGPADPTRVGEDEYGFIREAFGWLLVAFVLVGVCIGMGFGVSVLARAIQ